MQIPYPFKSKVDSWLETHPNERITHKINISDTHHKKKDFIRPNFSFEFGTWEIDLVNGLCTGDED
jgi:hypothetical protein